MTFKATHKVVGNNGPTKEGNLEHYFDIGTEVMEVYDPLDDDEIDEEVGLYKTDREGYQYIVRTDVQPINQ